MFIVPLPLIRALQRSAMCFQSIELHVAPDGATCLGFVRGSTHFAPPEQRPLCPLRAFRAKPLERLNSKRQHRDIE